MTPTSTTDMPYALALMDVVQQAGETWMEDHHLSDADRKVLWGIDRIVLIRSARPVYRARPFNGVWATAPYLHNGSVPSLYWMLRPAAEHPTSFCQGTATSIPSRSVSASSPARRLIAGPARRCSR